MEEREHEREQEGEEREDEREHEREQETEERELEEAQEREGEREREKALLLKGQQKMHCIPEETIRVRVVTDDKSLPLALVVRIDYTHAALLPFLGGFLNKNTGVYYLNAAQQTHNVHTQVQDKTSKSTRDTQLCLHRNQCWNTVRETWTQMDRRDLFLDCSRDYTLQPRPYKDSTVWDKQRVGAIIVIQKFTRRWIARQSANRIRKHASERYQFLKEQENQRKLEVERLLEQEIKRHKNPRTTNDFNVLYQELESWHLEELKAIKTKVLDPNERKSAVQDLLRKEVRLLQALDKRKLVAAKVNRDENIRKMMLKMSGWKIWELSNGNIVHVKTPATQRAFDLMQLYVALEKHPRTIDERMCVLGYVKWTVEEFSCPFINELLRLIEREADLMYRNRPAKTLTGLRKRILELFLQFLKTPEFNPEASAYQYLTVDFDHASRQSLVRRNAPHYSQMIHVD